MVEKWKTSECKQAKARTQFKLSYANEQIDGRKSRQTLAEEAAQGSLSNNGDNAKDNVN